MGCDPGEMPIYQKKTGRRRRDLRDNLVNAGG